MNINTLAAIIANLTFLFDELCHLRGIRWEQLTWKDNGQREEWDAIETGGFVKVIDGTQMERKFFYPYCCEMCELIGFDYENEDYVSNASRKIRTIRATLFSGMRARMGRMLNELEQARFENAVDRLGKIRNAIETDYCTQRAAELEALIEADRQAAFETQMELMGNDADEIAEQDQEMETIRHSFWDAIETETYVVMNQPSLFGYKCRPRYQRHYGTQW